MWPDSICNVQLMPASQSFATYDTFVADVRSIVVAPALLESTLHVIAWGRDLYYVLMRPSHGFDKLGDDFAHSLLSVALVAMTASVLSISGLVSHARSNAKWN